jgi:DNA-binding PadR family transcriptional regulator
MKHAVLGLVVQRPSYAYELAQRFHGRVGPGWSLHSSHIYHSLEQLEAEGLVEARIRARDRKHYFPTPGGRREFERWLIGGPVEVKPVREEMYLRILVCPPHHIAGLIELFALQEKATYEELQRLSAERAAEQSLRAPIYWSRAAAHMIVEGQVARVEADLAWLRSTRRTLAWLKDQDLRWDEISGAGESGGAA